MALLHQHGRGGYASQSIGGQATEDHPQTDGIKNLAQIGEVEAGLASQHRINLIKERISIQRQPIKTCQGLNNSGRDIARATGASQYQFAWTTTLGQRRQVAAKAIGADQLGFDGLASGADLDSGLGLITRQCLGGGRFSLGCRQGHQAQPGGAWFQGLDAFGGVPAGGQQVSAAHIPLALGGQGQARFRPWYQRADQSLFLQLGQSLQPGQPARTGLPAAELQQHRIQL